MDIIFLIASFIFYTSVRAYNCKGETKCRTSKIHGLRTADCYDRNFKDIPQCLRSDVEVIDLSVNRIKQIKQRDLAPYGNLKGLYLQENILMKIHENAFDGMDGLVALDLSNNGLSTIPAVIFHLPSLQSVYLGQNMNMNIIDIVNNAIPITAPLTKFDISFNELDELPELGVLPYLVFYNISGNDYTSIGIRHFAGLCNLKSLANSNISLRLDEPCDCWTVNRWLTEKGVKFTPFVCEIQDKYCDIEDIPERYLQLYQECRDLSEEITKKVMIMKYVVPIVSTLVGVILILAICFYCRRKRKRQRASVAATTKNHHPLLPR